MFCVALRINSTFCLIHHKLTGFYNRRGECFTARYGLGPYITRLRLVLKGLIIHFIHRYVSHHSANNVSISGTQNPGRQVALAICVYIRAMLPNTCRTSVQNMFHVTFLAPRYFELAPSFLEYCASLMPLRPFVLLSSDL